MLTLLPLTVGCGNSDRARPIKEGIVPIEGCSVNYITLEPEEVFFRAFKSEEFDVTELSFSSYVLSTSKGECPYIAIPAFVSRMFRHSGIYIRTDRGINAPADLRGKTIGVPEYQMTAIVWMRGMLKEEYGVDPKDIHWVSGGQEEPGRGERTPLTLTNGVDLKPIPEGKTLSRMLAAGEIDGIMSARLPSAFASRAPNVGRLFPDYKEKEKAYFKKTGHFPIMHLIAVRKSLAEANPWLCTSVYKAFLKAKEIAMHEVRQAHVPMAALPWMEAEALETIALMGEDYWPYGVKENLKDIEAMARYSYDQGLAVRKMKPEELFAKSTLEISRI
jgi:4,5-dihydroxyphthalate decarboxylase